MPSWKLHREIASRMEIPEDLTNEINRIIDFEGIHDGREIPEVFIKDARRSYEIGGNKGLEAFFLHHILDRLEQKLLGEEYKKVWGKQSRDLGYILNSTIIDAEDWINRNLKNFEYKHEAKKALNKVIEFVQSNFIEIIKLLNEELYE